MQVRDSAGSEPEKPASTDSDALLSDDGTYRYRLSRRWDDSRPVLAFVLLNPSTADGHTDDRTVTRCVKYASGMGFGELVVANLFALRSSDPAALDEHPAPVGPENDRHLRAVCAEADRVIAGWGNHGAKRDRAREVVARLDTELYAIDTTNAGHPRHPSRTPYDTTIERFSYEG